MQPIKFICRVLYPMFVNRETYLKKNGKPLVCGFKRDCLIYMLILYRLVFGICVSEVWSLARHVCISVSRFYTVPE